DENEVQEVLPATLALESSKGYDIEESSHQGLKSTLEWLPVEMLKLLYNSKGCQ
ncbi:18924_t:CDS:1, partial [Gigaspora rosea]